MWETIQLPRVQVSENNYFILLSEITNIISILLDDKQQHHHNRNASQFELVLVVSYYKMK